MTWAIHFVIAELVAPPLSFVCIEESGFNFSVNK